MDKGRTKTFTELKKTNRKKKQINSKSFIIDILLNCDQINKIQSVSKPMQILEVLISNIDDVKKKSKN